MRFVFCHVPNVCTMGLSSEDQVHLIWVLYYINIKVTDCLYGIAA